MASAHRPVFKNAVPSDRSAGRLNVSVPPRVDDRAVSLTVRIPQTFRSTLDDLVMFGPLIPTAACFLRSGPSHG